MKKSFISRRRRITRKHKKLLWILLSIVLFVAITLSILFYDKIFVNEDSTGEESSSSENPNGRAPLQDDADRGGSRNETVFGGEYDPTVLPVEKPDYAQHSYQETSGGLANWLVQNTDQYYFNPETGEMEKLEGAAQIGGGGQPQANEDTYESKDFSPGDGIRDLDSSAQIRDLIEQSVDEEVIWYSNHFGSRSAGFTNNPDEFYNADGTRNWDYSFVLAEDIQFFFGHNLERLINPVYGDWVNNQYPNSGLFSVGEFRPMFTEEWWMENIEEGDESNLPVFADWDNDNYASYISSETQLPSEGPRWVGDIDSYEFNMVETFDGRSFALEVKIELTYTSYSENSGTISVPSTLDITLIPNYDNPDLYNYKMIISDVEQRIEQPTQEQ